MSKLILETIRDELRTCSVIDGEGEFCRDWLGKSECYLRTLRFINGVNRPQFAGGSKVSMDGAYGKK